jgi:hypothetical protein
MSGRAFSHPNLGREVRVEQDGRTVKLAFICGTRMQADALCEDLLRQLKSGALHMTLMGKPTSITED